MEMAIAFIGLGWTHLKSGSRRLTALVSKAPMPEPFTAARLHALQWGQASGRANTPKDHEAPDIIVSLMPMANMLPWAHVREAWTAFKGTIASL